MGEQLYNIIKIRCLLFLFFSLILGMFLFDPSCFSIYTRYILYFVLIIYCLTFTGGPWLQDRFPGYYVHSCCS